MRMRIKLRGRMSTTGNLARFLAMSAMLAVLSFALWFWLPRAGQQAELLACGCANHESGVRVTTKFVEITQGDEELDFDWLVQPVNGGVDH